MLFSQATVSWKHSVVSVFLNFLLCFVCPDGSGFHLVVPMDASIARKDFHLVGHWVPSYFLPSPILFHGPFEGVDTMECLPMTLPQPGGLRIRFSGWYSVEHFILIAVDNPKELTPTQTTLLTSAWVTFLTFLAESPGLSTLHFWIQDIMWLVD